MNDRLECVGRWFARFATDALVARPRLWRLFRRPLRAQFDPGWSDISCEFPGIAEEVLNDDPHQPAIAVSDETTLDVQINLPVRS